MSCLHFHRFSNLISEHNTNGTSRTNAFTWGEIVCPYQYIGNDGSKRKCWKTLSYRKVVNCELGCDYSVLRNHLHFPRPWDLFEVCERKMDNSQELFSKTSASGGLLNIDTEENITIKHPAVEEIQIRSGVSHQTKEGTIWGSWRDVHAWTLLSG